MERPIYVCDNFEIYPEEYLDDTVKLEIEFFDQKHYVYAQVATLTFDEVENLYKYMKEKHNAK